MGKAFIAILSDFGSREVFVGVMKGVLARTAPKATLIDLTHEIPAGDVRQAAFRLWQALPHMPPRTIFLAVVDPGVGTHRRALAVRCGEFTCVGPDNGIFTYLLHGRRARAVEIARLESFANLTSRAKSNTFHGRDVFAPAAGLLASGMDIGKLGPDAADIVTIPWPRLSAAHGERSILGETLFADRFGNVVTSIGALVVVGERVRMDPWVPGCRGFELPSLQAKVRLGQDLHFPLVRTFAEVPEGCPLGYIGSDNLLEIGVNRGSAADFLRIAPGMKVTLSWD